MTIAAKIGATLLAPFTLFGGGSAVVSHQAQDHNTSSSVQQNESCVTLDHSLYYGASDRMTNGEVTELQTYLYTSGYLKSSPTGFYGLATVRAVKNFQSDHNIQATGYVGGQTRAEIKKDTCNNDTNDNGKQVRISSIDAPAALAVNETGTFTVNAKENSNDNLHYSVVWGDENQGVSALARNAAMIRASSSFEHAYTVAGTYTPTFTVSDDHGNTVTKSVTVKVGDESNVSISSINPTSGLAGSKATINGAGFSSDTMVHFNGSSITPTISDRHTLSFIIPSVGAGTYNVAVENANGTSNVLTFKVTAPATRLSISGVDAPVALTVGQSGTWTVHVDSSASGNLHYAVVWGDENASPMMRMSAQETISSSGTFSHTYDAKGNYAPKFTVSDDNGHTVSVSTTVHVMADNSK